MAKDVKIAEAKTSHCSERIWAAAHALKDYMMKVDLSGCQVLELGSGTGWLSLELAAANPTASITATDHPDYMSALHESIRLSSSITNVQARGLDWDEPWPFDDFQKFNGSSGWIIGYVCKHSPQIPAHSSYQHFTANYNIALRIFFILFHSMRFLCSCMHQICRVGT